jgi:hypothetical protein
MDFFDIFLHQQTQLIIKLKHRKNEHYRIKQR